MRKRKHKVEVKPLAGPGSGKNFGATAKKPESDDKPLPKRPSGHLPVAKAKADQRKGLLKRLGHRGI